MGNLLDRRITLYAGEDIVYISLFSSGLMMNFPLPITITAFKIEELREEETPQNPEYRFKHLSEEPIG